VRLQKRTTPAASSVLERYCRGLDSEPIARRQIFFPAIHERGYLVLVPAKFRRNPSQKQDLVLSQELRNQHDHRI
jgi:hypothetical protein